MIINTNSCSLVRRTEGLNAYLADIRNYKVLSPEEESDLFAEYEFASEYRKSQIKTQIINSNQRFVYACAKRFSSKAETIMDMVDEANLGLAEAFDRYDPTMGFRFLTFAQSYVKRGIYNYLKDSKLIQRSNETVVGIRLNKIRERFLAENCREASDEEVIEILDKEYGITVKNVRDVQSVSVDYIDNPISSDDDTTLADVGDFASVTSSTNEYEETIRQESIKEKIDTALLTISPRNREIVKRLFGIDCDREYTPDDVAEEFGMTTTRVMQIKQKAIADLAKTKYLFAE